MLIAPLPLPYGTPLPYGMVIGHPINGKLGYIFGVCGMDQSVHLSYKCIAMKESDTEMSEMIT